MALRDDDISDWFTTASENPPEDGTLIGRDLADQFRNYKSNVRSESLNKQWQKLNYLVETTSTGATFTIAFDAEAGDMTGYFTETRKVRLVKTSGVGSVYCGVISASFTSSTSVILIALDGAVTNQTEYSVAVGTEDPEGSHLPAYGQAATLTISGANTNGTVTLDRAEADTAYFVKTTLISTNSAVSGANVVIGLDKTVTDFVVHLAAAPGGSTETVIGCTLLREM
jgi:hypothetical protein